MLHWPSPPRFHFFYWLNKRQVIFNTNSRVVGVITILVSGSEPLVTRGSPIGPAPTQCVRARVLMGDTVGHLFLAALAERNYGCLNEAFL